VTGFLTGAYHITCKGLLEGLVNVHVLSAIHHSLAITRDPSLCSYHSHMCEEPRMITFNSKLIISCLDSCLALHCQLFLLLMETVLYMHQTVLYMYQTVLYRHQTVLYMHQTILYMYQTVLYMYQTVLNMHQAPKDILL
jgi:hypothetical protein